jgi:LysM repeat protein
MSRKRVDKGAQRVYHLDNEEKTMASSIGIKIANGEFYSVLEEGSSNKKRLILTTVHDGQSSVQIDLYRSAALTMADAAYIGSLVVESIAPRPRGEPSIELVIGFDGGDELNAAALDLDASSGGERQQLTVSLQALDENRTYEVPDFELEPDVPPPAGLYEPPAEPAKPAARSQLPLGPIAVGAAAVLVIIIIGWMLVGRSPAPAPAAAPAAEAAAPAVEAAAPSAEPASEPAAPAPAAAAAEPAAPAVAEPVPAAPTAPLASRARPVPPVESYKVPSVIPAEGAKYKVRWGDTLWDISEAFYRNPWLYPRIARFNKIRNPDLIVAGTTIRVPPKN